jgi:3alpha(or 20beta)-hydroxysteroid dehydrogenase
MIERGGRLTGKVALVTGGARGQGECEARMFVDEGAQVMVTDVLDDLGAKVATDIGDSAAFCHHDVRSEDDWESVVEATKETFGRIDVLINNAGIFRVVPMLQTSVDLYREVTDINQLGVFLGMRAVAPVMIEQGTGGAIVNISSVAGLMASSTAFAYGASKWAVRGMTKAAARELAPYRIRVNSVHPGLVTTAMLDEFGAGPARDRLRDIVPLGEESGPEEIAKMVLFLSCDESRHATGHEFVVDGGITA